MSGAPTADARRQRSAARAKTSGTTRDREAQAAGGRSGGLECNATTSGLAAAAGSGIKRWLGTGRSVKCKPADNTQPQAQFGSSQQPPSADGTAAPGSVGAPWWCWA